VKKWGTSFNNSPLQAADLSPWVWGRATVTDLNGSRMLQKGTLIGTYNSSFDLEIGLIEIEPSRQQWT
jgi:hypothetical protein